MQHCEGQKDASTCCLAAQGFDKDAVGIVIVYDEDIIVARAGGNDEFAVLVGMNSPCGGFKQSGKTLMRVEVIDVAKRERGGGFSRWDEVVAVGNVDGGAAVVTLVDRGFFLVWSRYPLIVATDCGGCSRCNLAIRSRQLGRYPRSSAVVRVDKAGEKRAAWAKATNSAGVAELVVAKP